jgi:long-subunit fatty acid transport protein
MKNIRIPIIKNIDAKTLAADICSVQPMACEAGEVFNLASSVEAPPAPEGSIRHSFTEGWQVKYGDEWVDYGDWVKLKIKGL